MMSQPSYCVMTTAHVKIIRSPTLATALCKCMSTNGHSFEIDIDASAIISASSACHWSLGFACQFQSLSRDSQLWVKADVASLIEP